MPSQILVALGVSPVSCRLAPAPAWGETPGRDARATTLQETELRAAATEQITALDFSKGGKYCLSVAQLMKELDPP